MASVFSYVLDCLKTYGIAILVAFALGGFIGYLFFRSRSKDERESIETIKESKKVLDADLKTERAKRLEAESKVGELSVRAGELSSEVRELTRQVNHWKSKASSNPAKGDGPLDDALNVFTR